MSHVISKRTLSSKINKICSDESLTFPQVVTLCEGIGQPVYKITIEKDVKDYFVDDKGQKWVKA